MTHAFETIALIGKYQHPEYREKIVSLAQFLQSRQKRVILEEKTAHYCEITDYEVAQMHELGKSAHLAMVLGGDGTMLGVARAMVDENVPLVGINEGRLGFLTDIVAEHMLASVERILQGDYFIEKRMMLTASVMRNGQQIASGRALNDIVVSKSGAARLIELQVEIDGHFVNRQRADGLIISTPTGTTAYALSAGGPILHPALDAMAIVPICPHALTNRPFAISGNSEVIIRVTNKESASVHYDAQMQVEVYQGDYIVIQKDRKMLSLLHLNGHTHYNTLREKLHWG